MVLEHLQIIILKNIQILNQIFDIKAYVIN